MNVDDSWEDNTFAGLEGLDERGQDRVSQLGHLADDPDEPDLVATGMPVFEELELDDAVRLA